ncbi:MAG: hypothetical protein ACI37Q_00730 [Candidatus Gastranaerophilaceae bacterium]
MQYQEYDYDLLLEYLSRKESESYVNFKKFVLNLNYELTKESLCQKLIDNSQTNCDIDTKFRKEQLSFIRNTRKMLSRLSHCEFCFANNDNNFTVTPPVICMLNNSYKGILCGKRTSDITNEIQTICEQTHCDYTEERNINAPNVIFVNFKNQENRENFEAQLQNAKFISDLKIQENFSEIILTNVPKVCDLKQAVKQGDLVEVKDYDENIIENKQIFDFRIFECKKFGFIQLCGFHDVSDWSVIKDDRNTYNQSYYIKYGKKYYYIDKHYGILLNLYYLNKKPLLRWENNKLIKKNFWLQFPELIERALTLQSGYNTEDNKNEVIYRNIDIRIAELLTKTTGLEIEYAE